VLLKQNVNKIINKKPKAKGIEINVERPVSVNVVTPNFQNISCSPGN
jgi:hypothetical protein